MAKAELRGHFKEAVLAWVDAAADPTKGVELVRTAEETHFCNSVRCCRVGKLAQVCTDGCQARPFSSHETTYLTTSCHSSHLGKETN